MQRHSFCTTARREMKQREREKDHRAHALELCAIIARSRPPHSLLVTACPAITDCQKKVIVIIGSNVTLNGRGVRMCTCRRAFDDVRRGRWPSPSHEIGNGDAFARCAKFEKIASDNRELINHTKICLIVFSTCALSGGVSSLVWLPLFLFAFALANRFGQLWHRHKHKSSYRTEKGELTVLVESSVLTMP